MGEPRGELVKQLRRQVEWLEEHWLWLVRTRIIEGQEDVLARPRALDVGCGPGYVLEVLSADMDIVGVDRDPDMVAMGRGRGLDVREGDAGALPFDNGEFDLAFCSFLLMWVDDPAAVLAEMARVSRRWVVCLAEPDYGGRIDHPEGLARLGDLLVKGLQAQGADPLMGRRLRGLMSAIGLEAEVGIHPGGWSTDRLREETEAEWRFVEGVVGSLADEEELGRIRSAWDDALEKGALFQFCPTFYAFGKKKR